MKKVVLPDKIRQDLERENSFLGRSDIVVFATHTNRDALDIHRREKTDLIVGLLDTEEMNGEELCSAVRDDDELRGVSLIVVSSGLEGDLDRCLNCRANAFLTMPVSGPVLLQEAYQLLNIAPRMSFRIPLRVKLEGAAKKSYFTGFVENISASGMLFRSVAVLFEGDTMKCTFSLPGRRRLAVDAEVIRMSHQEGKGHANLYGVRFTDPGTAAPVIEAFVRQKTDDDSEILPPTVSPIRS